MRRALPLFVVATLVIASVVSAAPPSKATPTPRDHVVYLPKYEDPVLKQMEDARKEAAKKADDETGRVREAQKQKAEAAKKDRKTLRFDMTKLAKPASPEAFKPAWHNPPVAQYNTGTCWSFSTTSFYESEVFRLTGEKVKLSEIWTVYWEYVEKVRRFVRERGDSLIAEGSEANAVERIWKAYGAVPAEAYPGALSADGRHDHEHLIGQLNELADWVKAHDAWDEERVLAMARVILDRELGVPPTNFTYQGTPYSPKEFLAKVLKLDLDAYVEVMSTLSVPFWTKASYDVPDNWWKDSSYNNVPLDVWYSALVGAVKAGNTVAIGGDVSEPGINGFEDAAVIPTFDIPQEYIDQDSRELRFENHTSEDDHGIHLVGMTTTPDGHAWFLIKDSGRSSRWGKFQGYYFYRDDFIKLKMLTYTVHKDAVKEILARMK